MRVYKASSFSKIYEGLLLDLVRDPDIKSSPRGLETKELYPVWIELENPKSSLFKNKRRSTPKKYLAGEIVWYFSGIKDIGFISNFSRFWDRIKNDDNTANSAYGNLVFRDRNKHGFSEYEWAYQSLSNDLDTRQSIVRFNKQNNSYKGNKDFICTLTGVFMARNESLNFTVRQRSSDCITGITFDIPFFSLLQQQMLVHLQDQYPKLKLGKLSLLIDSAHLYKHHFGLAEKMLEEEFIAEELPQLRESLINCEGEALQETKHLYEGDPVESDDRLINWLYENISCEDDQVGQANR